MNWLTPWLPPSWDEARRHKRGTRVALFVSYWVLSIGCALFVLGSALNDVLVSVAFATVVALLATLAVEPLLRQEPVGWATRMSGTARAIGGVAGLLVFVLSTRVVGGLIGLGIVIVGVTAVMAVMVWAADR